MRLVEPDELYETMQRDGAFVIDVRNEKAFRESTEHIPGDLRYPPDQVEHWYLDMPLERWIVAYCTCPDDGNAVQIAEFLSERGYTADALKGGFDAWKERGYPVDPLPAEERRAA